MSDPRWCRTPRPRPWRSGITSHNEANTSSLPLRLKGLAKCAKRDRLRLWTGTVNPVNVNVKSGSRTAEMIAPSCHSYLLTLR